MSQLYLGIDIGTSGCRACVINDDSQVIHISSQNIPSPEINNNSIVQNADIWWQAVQSLLNNVSQHIDTTRLKAIAIDGTSGTLLVTDKQGTPLDKARMYNDSFCSQQAEAIKRVAPPHSAVHSSSSGLAKLLYLQDKFPQAQHACHQADWIVGKLSGQFNISDENNALKTGYDPIAGVWPEWLNQLNVNRDLLPDVVPPGVPIGSLSDKLAKQFNFNGNLKIVSGTTDSIAAFMATGAQHIGEAVTSLGSTLVLKIISAEPINSAEYGIYSHKLGDAWLAGGASNSGGAVLKHFFTDKQLNTMTPLLRPEQTTHLNYYPLYKAGERFPISDPLLEPELTPRPDDDVTFFQGMLEGMSNIEQDGYKKLHQLGAPFPTKILTAGRGSQNSGWTIIRSNKLGVPILATQYNEACYGSALLALRAFK